MNIPHVKDKKQVSEWGMIEFQDAISLEPWSFRLGIRCVIHSARSTLLGAIWGVGHLILLCHTSIGPTRFPSFILTIAPIFSPCVCVCV